MAGFCVLSSDPVGLGLIPYFVTKINVFFFGFRNVSLIINKNAP